MFRDARSGRRHVISGRRTARAARSGNDPVTRGSRRVDGRIALTMSDRWAHYRRERGLCEIFPGEAGRDASSAAW